MKKKLLMLALMVVLVASALALSISAANIVKLDYDPGLDCEDSLVSILDGEYAPYTPVTWASVTGGLDENARCVLTDGNGGYYVFPSWYIYKDEAYETNNANNHNGYRHCINYTRLNAAIAKYNTDNQTEHFASYSVSSSNHANLVRLTMIEGVANLAQNTQKFQNSALLVELRFPSTMSTTDAQNALDKTPLTKVDLSMTTITTLPNAFCANMASLTEVKLPDTITKINGSVFAECGELTTINIPSSLKEIGSKAFYNCKKMQYISGTDGLLIFPEGFTSISANSAFYNCDLIKYVEFPSTFTYLGQAAFNDCSNLLLVSFMQKSSLLSQMAKNTPP